MQQFFQFIGNLLSNPLAFVILFALFGAIGRFGGWVKDQRVRRAAAMERARREAEALRTGKPIQSEEQQEETSGQSAAAERQARLRAMQEQRAAQLRELQQRRLAELRAKRAAAQASAQSGAPTMPAPPASLPGRSRGTRPNTPRSRPNAPQVQARPSDRVATPPPPRVEPPPRPQPQAQPSRQPRPATPAPRVPVTPQAERTVAPDMVRGGKARQMLFPTREDLRRAIIAAEVLDPPVASREPDRRAI